MSDSKRDLKALCRGNRTDRGWTQTDEGNWVPSVHDRRRVAVAHVNALAENQGGAVFGPQVLGILQNNSTSGDDYAALLTNFEAWNKAISE